MKGKSEMEILYDKYLQSDDKKVVMNGSCFYKIIQKDRLPIRDGTVLIVVPREIFNHRGIDTVVDETGKTFKIGAAAFMSFSGSVPKWYLETATIPVEGIHEKDEIGNYIAVV